MMRNIFLSREVIPQKAKIQFFLMCLERIAENELFTFLQSTGSIENQGRFAFSRSMEPCPLSPFGNFLPENVSLQGFHGCRGNGRMETVLAGVSWNNGYVHVGR